MLNHLPLVMLGSIAAGSLIGHHLQGAGPWLGNHVDPTLLTLVFLLFFGVRFQTLMHATGNWRFLGMALAINFVLVPAIGYGVATFFLHEHPLLMLGLLIYFMAPCTDWFLGFTRLSGGNVALGTTLIPLNMLAQLVLYPLYLRLFAPKHIAHPVIPTDSVPSVTTDSVMNHLPTFDFQSIQPALIGNTLLQWFLLPLLAAIMLHQLLRRALPARSFERLLDLADRATIWVLALLVLQIFAGNVQTILSHAGVFTQLLLAVFVFFVLTALLGEAASRLTRQAHAEHALLTMTIAARNAPLMLAVTLTILPDQPLVHAALIIGMLLEFPHLTALQRLLLRGSQKTAADARIAEIHAS